MEQKILYVLEAKDRGLNAQLTDAREQVRRLSAELRKTKDGSDEYKRLTGEVGRAKDEVSKLAKEQRQFNRDMEAMKAPKDSLIGLRNEYSKLSAQIAQLSEAERKGSFGKALIRNAKSVKSEIDGIEQSIGRFTGNVGNYKSALAGLGDAITGGLVTGGVVVAVEKLLGLMKQGVDQAVKYEKALDDLSALTGVTGQGLKELQGVEQALRKIEVGGAEIVNTGPEILESLKLVGGARPELLKDADALGAVAKEAIILSKASGDDLPSSVTALTTVLGQFSLKAKDSGRVINELAAGAKAGASEIPDTTDALKEFGTTAKSVNATTSESVALIQLLADRQLKGSEAGTQLRNVLTKLAAADVLPRTAQDEFKRYGVNINILKDASLPLVDRLKELAKVQGDVGALTKIFGLENLQAANIITDGVGKYADLQKAIEGTNEAYKQAEIRSDNAATKIENLKNKVLNGLQESMENASPTIDAVSGSLGFLIEKMGAIDGVFTLAIGPIKQVIDAFYRTKDAIGSLFGEVDNATKQAAQTDSVSAELQDQLDRAAQFNERGRELYLEKVAPRKPKSGTKGESAPKTIDNEAKAAAGSIAFLEKKVKDLTDALNKAPEGKIDEIIGKLVPAEKELKDAKDYVEFLKSGGYGDRAPIDFLPTKQDLETALTEAQRLFDERKLKVDLELQTDNRRPY
jgi:TP901 family phage tail tape measure protein